MERKGIWRKIGFLMVVAIFFTTPDLTQAAPSCGTIVSKTFSAPAARAMHKAPGKSDPRCALRGHMWAAGCLLDWLKNGVTSPGNAKKSAKALKRIERLMATLRTAPPYSVARLSGAKKQRAMRGFRGCLGRVVRLAAKAQSAVRSGRYAQAKTFVNRMDATAHRCHLKFVWPKYPPRKDGRCPPSIPDIF